MPTIQRGAYATSDEAGALEFLDRIYGALPGHAAVRGGEREARLSQIEAGDVATADLDLPLDLSFQITGRGGYVFSVLIAGTAECEREGTLDCFVPGEVTMSARPEDDYRAHAHGAHVLTATLPQSLLDDLVRPSLEAPVPRWEFLARRAVPGGYRRWRQAIQMFEDALGTPGGADSSLVFGRARRLLGVTALTTFPNTAAEPERLAEHRDAHPATLRRAIAFIEAAPDTDITLGDIARAANVTTRAIQHAFRRHLETTPMAYLRRVRLDQAHRRLRTADPDGETTVAQVALDWGFANPSRFARYYREAYGRVPSETLAE